MHVQTTVQKELQKALQRERAYGKIWLYMAVSWRDGITRAAMTARSLRLAGNAASGVRWDWLAPAVIMAAAACASQPLTADSASLDWTCFPRLATRTPGLDARSVGEARDFSLSVLGRWGVAERADDIAVVVSELLTNVLRHARPEGGGQHRLVRLGLVKPGPLVPSGPLQPGHLIDYRQVVLCAVADPSTRTPVPKEPDYLAESGRGLHVISALSDFWGCTTPTERGKVVWAVFSVPVVRPEQDPGRWVTAAGPGAWSRSVSPAAARPNSLLR
jgi:hypothetical protein